MVKKLDISVVIPTLGREHLVRRAIASVLAQSCQAREIIIVDDGSEPPISEQVLELSKSLRLIRLPVNRGVSCARNIGIQAAQAEYIALLDSDDTWKPLRLELAKAKIGSFPFAERIIFFDNLVAGERVISRPPPVISNSRDLAEGLVTSGFLIPTPSLIFHSKWRACLQFDETLRHHEDWDFLVSAVAKGFCLINLDASQVSVGGGVFRSRLSTQRNTHSAARFVEKNRAYMSPDIVAQFEDLNIRSPRSSRLQYISMVLRYLSRNQVSRGGALSRLLMATGLRRGGG